MGPASVRQSSRPFSSWASGNAFSASEHFKDWGEQWQGYQPCPSPHTDWHPQCRAPPPGSRLPLTVGPIGHLGAEGWVPSSQQRRGKASLPVRGRQGRVMPSPPSPPAVSAQGAPSTLLGSVSPHLAGPWAAPARGSRGSCYSVPNPTGHRAIYLDVGPAPPLTSPTLSTSGKAALYAHLPPLSICPRASQQPCVGMGFKRQVTDTRPVACNAEGPGSSLFS